MSRYEGWFDLLGEGLERQRPERRLPPSNPLKMIRESDMTDRVARLKLAKGKNAREDITDRVLGGKDASH
jgi:hypothetical protein